MIFEKLSQVSVCVDEAKERLFIHVCEEISRRYQCSDAPGELTLMATAAGRKVFSAGRKACINQGST